MAAQKIDDLHHLGIVNESVHTVKTKKNFECSFIDVSPELREKHKNLGSMV